MTKEITVKEMAHELNVSESSVRRRLKSAGFVGDLNKIRGGRLFAVEAINYLKYIYNNKPEIIQVPLFIEVHHNYYIYESKINKRR
jgi:hypothetical protein